MYDFSVINQKLQMKTAKNQSHTQIWLLVYLFYSQFNFVHQITWLEIKKISNIVSLVFDLVFFG